MSAIQERSEMGDGEGSLTKEMKAAFTGKTDQADNLSSLRVEATPGQ